MRFRPDRSAAGRLAAPPVRRLLSAVLLGAACLAPTVAAVGRADEPAPLVDYQDGSGFLATSPAVGGGAVGAPFNPAAWATGDRAELAFWWDDRSHEAGTLDDFGFSLGHHLGLAYWRRTLPAGGRVRRLEDWQLGLALGGRDRVLGIAYRWAGGGGELLPNEDALVLGSIARPSRHLSFGLASHLSVESDAWLAIGDLGLRPLGRDWLTLFADYSLRDGQELAGGLWGAGLAVVPLPGLQLGAKLREDERGGDPTLTLHLGVTLDGLGLHVLPGLDRDGDLARTTYLVRAGASYRSLPIDPDPFPEPPRYVPFDLENRRLTYQRYRWFDRRRVAWLDLSTALDRVRDSDEAAGVALDLADFRMRPSLAWELRRKLLELRAAGKEVLVHVGDVGMLEYWVASAADRLTIDPLGTVMLPGVALERTYVRDMLDRIGVGVQELRYLTYKSALETFSRRDMSPADREQRQRIVDVVYDTVAGGVSRDRDLARSAFDRVVDDEVMLTADLALAAGLVDTIARWHELPEWLAEHRGGARLAALPRSEGRRWREERWGEPPRIAVVYLVGPTEMDVGIGGRAASAYLRDLVGRDDVAAVVLRADSPGGDPLPSDLVAEATSMLEEAGKPVIVSQGDVAASGGYWISMRGTRILTTPLTITGSIGVIAGWFWDDGIGHKLGLDTDGVHRGRHADLFGTLTFPLLGAGLPTRALDETELALVRSRILDMYDGFVRAVAESRDLPEARVREIAEGRVWMGGDALRIGLVDQIGGLDDAIAVAREAAGLAPGAEIVLEEYPPRPLIELPSLLPGLPNPLAALAGLGVLPGRAAGTATGRGVPGRTGDAGADDEAGAPDAVVGYLRAAAGAPGLPLLMLHPDELPAAWRQAD